jgi:uncharacterized membrane protein YozB (DUF420 family)
MGISARNFRYCLVLVAGGIVVGYWAAQQFGPVDFGAERVINLFAVVAQIAATMMGFLLAALAILASIAGMRLLRNMQRTGHYTVLLTRLFISATFFFLLMLEAGTAMFLGNRLPLAMEMLFGLIFACCASLVEASLKLTAVLMALKPTGKALE